MTQRLQAKEDSIKQLRSHLEHLTNELSKTTEYIQLLELQDGLRVKKDDFGFEPEQEISDLLQKQNTISHEIILVRKRIQKLSAKTILKIELLILPIVVILLFFVAANYVIPSANIDSTIKTRYVTENLQGTTTDDFMYWDVNNQTPMVVTIENNAKVTDQKIQSIENAITSTETITGDSSQLYHSNSGTGKYFIGWQGALETAPVTKHNIPEKFNVIQSSNEEGQIVITLSKIKDRDGYYGTTRTIVNGNQILKVFITIYDADKLTNTQIGSIVRHEFGHALGLPLTNNAADLMYESITTNHPYISECDINALQKLYNGIKLSDDFCDNA
ncbi:MAG: matrixin family metalloprotease [Thaumarchaeota archaeon]|nr:matrixin family metalloprotease [Nitrososphaerota archaeon]MDE1875867.1 matrixin family metalloprotease [Nitrososphaerota archaeon]